MKIPQDSHGTQCEPSGLSFAMQVIPGIEHAILMLHQAIYGIGRAMRSYVIGSRRITWALLPELDHHFLQVSGKFLVRPLVQASQALRELPVR
jgi:hypothetical protein